MISATIPLALIISGFAMGFMTSEKELFKQLFLSAVAVGAWSYIAVISYLMDALSRTEKLFDMKNIAYKRAIKTLKNMEKKQ